jgi:hypothetical protein
MSAEARHGRQIVIAAIVLGAFIVLSLNLLAWLQGKFHPLLPLKAILTVFWFRAIWLGNEVARNGLIAVLCAVVLGCILAATVSGQLAVAAVAIPLGLCCGVLAWLLATRPVGAFLRAQRGISLSP